MSGASRLGPPHPRSEKPFDEGYAPPAREQAWRQWIADQQREGYYHSTHERAVALAGFNAGWEARKIAQYEHGIKAAEGRKGASISARPTTPPNFHPCHCGISTGHCTC